ncbi:hypothetical protein [Pengzhenrongella phosphoraccumulans]|uniref:hypothetical protein n=1 Tax=Pengzhenrongella phosphoraccumulans TaxID=3114394 RepID=UPI00388E4113
MPFDRVLADQPTVTTVLAAVAVGCAPGFTAAAGAATPAPPTTEPAVQYAEAAPPPRVRVTSVATTQTRTIDRAQRMTGPRAPTRTSVMRPPPGRR